MEIGELEVGKIYTERLISSKANLPFKGSILGVVKKVLEEGLEPTLLSELDPKSSASANFAIRAG